MAIFLNLLMVAQTFLYSESFFLQSPLSNVIRLRISTGSLMTMAGYISPEEDEEYRGQVSKSLQRPIKVKNADGVIDSQAALPLPCEGDVVLCPGKYKGEEILARIRFLQFISSSNSWIAEVSPLKEGKSPEVFAVDRGAKSYTAKITELKPVRAFFKRSENGYSVKLRSNSTEYTLRAPTYRDLPANFTLPVKAAVNATSLEEDLEKYEALKSRLVTSTLQFGAVGTVISTAAFGPDVGIPFLFGSTSGAAYLYLLGRRIDSIGAGYSQSASRTVLGKAEKLLVDARSLVPIIAIAILAAKNYYVDGRIPETFSVVTKQQFLGVIAGFLSNRVAILLTEIKNELRVEDLLSIVPGSLAEGYRASEKLKASMSKEAIIEEDIQSIVVLLTGPQAAGRSSLSKSILGDGKFDTKLRRCKFLTTDTAIWTQSPDRYRLVTGEDLNRLRDIGQLVYEGEEKGLFGITRQIALTLDDLRGGPSPIKDVISPCVIDGPPEMLEALNKVPSLKLLNIWISLQTKEQFIDKASRFVEVELQGLKQRGKQDITSQLSAEQVSDLVNEAAKDVTYYMTNAPRFEYTLLNSGLESETLLELEQLLVNSI